LKNSHEKPEVFSSFADEDAAPMPTGVRGSGQALLEFVVCASVILLATVGALQVFVSQWERAKCAVIAFEKTHSRLTNSSDPYPDFRRGFEFVETDRLVHGQALCGKAHEKVNLLRLEYMKW
jgi:hypothetical protein